MRQAAADEQEPVIDLLRQLAGDAPTIVSTHISIVVLGATRAYKLKRAVRFPYLDFSTPEKRLAMCRRELDLNQVFAPKLYLGAHRVTREADGELTLDGVGDLADAVVVMRRFDDEALFDALAQQGRLTKPMIEALATRIAQTHDAAPADFSRGGLAAMRRVLRQNAASLRAASVADAAAIDAHISALEAALETSAALIDARRTQGKVRRCHGDLTLRNICLYEGEPTLFDCLEFDDDIATIDVLYDLAFALMDLLRVGCDDFANLALNRYLDQRDETDGLPLLPFFMALRATIRAHVEASQQHGDVAQRYFALARQLMTPAQAAVIAIGGYSGAGKSSVAAELAPLVAPAPGSRILNSDRLRKSLFNVAPTERLPQAAYAPDVSARVYREMFDKAERIVASGWPVIVDAVFDRPEDRAEIERISNRLGAPFFGVWLDVDFAQRAARVDARIGDVSDATRAVLEKQMQKDPGAIAWTRIDASREASIIADAIASQTHGHDA